MKILRLDHVNIRTTQIDVLIDWYSSILGMYIGERPNFSFAGVWLYTGDLAAIHIVSLDSAELVGSEANLKLEHFAFAASGLNQFLEKLNQMDISYRRADITDMNIIQINLWDPDGNHVHLDFDSNE